MAASTGVITSTFTADPTSAPPAESTGVITSTMTGDPVSLEAVSAASTGVITSTMTADPTSAPPASSTGVITSTFFAEPVTAKPEEILGNSGFGGQVVVSDDSGRSVTFPYSDSLQFENLTRRASISKTLDTGVAIYDAGFYDVDRDVELVIEEASRAQIDAAKAMIASGAVTISSWDGWFLGTIQNVSAKGGDLSMRILISEKTS